MADETFETLLRDLLDLTPEQRRLVHRTMRELSGTKGVPSPTPRRPDEPLALPRPEEEKVIEAMQRLRLNYPMLSPDRLLGPASEIMMKAMTTPKEEHPALIDRLEVLFSEHYARYVETFDEESSK